MIKDYNPVYEYTIVPLCYVLSELIIIGLEMLIFDWDFLTALIFSFMLIIPTGIAIALAPVLIELIYPGHYQYIGHTRTHDPDCLTPEQSLDVLILKRDGKYNQAKDLESQYRQQNALEEIAKNTRK